MSSDFVSTLSELAQLRDSLDQQGERLVLTNGVFDLLHVGHVRYLGEAKKLGDCLVVAINADDSVRELKGPGRPVYSEAERAEILCALEAVDRVVVFRERRATEVIRQIRPHIYTKGGDYTPDSLIDEEKQLLDELNTEIRILSLVPGQSTTETLKKQAGDKCKDAGQSQRRIAILGSGQGSNAVAILEAIKKGELNAEVALILSDKREAAILRHAEEWGIPHLVIDPGTEVPGRLTDAAIKEIQDRLAAADIDLIVLAGFMRILREPLLSFFENRILNIHPSLLPKFPGLHACRRAIEEGEKQSGCTIHLVDSGVDSGEILAQHAVPILPDDTAERLQERIQREEHKLYPRVIGERLDKIG